MPRETPEAIGSKSRGSRDYVLADGKPVTLEATVAEIEFEGVIVGGTIAYGPEGTEPLPGVTALESGGFEIGPRNERLKRLPGVLMKRGLTEGSRNEPLPSDDGLVATSGMEGIET